MIRIAVFASGNGSNAESLIKHSRSLDQTEIVLVITDREKAAVIERCQNLNQKCLVVSPQNFESKKDHENEILKILIKEKVDWIFLCGYMRILSPHFLQVWFHFHGGANQIVNIHPSLLPDLPGGDSLNQAWNLKLKETGVTLHLVDEGVDTGPILDQKRQSIDLNGSFESYKEKMHALEHEMYKNFLVSLSLGSPKTIHLNEQLAKGV